MWTDTHCHLAGKEYDADRDSVFARAREAKVDTFVVIGAGDGLEANTLAIALAQKEKQTYAAIGIHPHDAGAVDDQENYLEKLKKWAADPKVVAIGEIGLDYHYDHSPREIQQKRFREQLALAKELQLPVTIHSREAWDDTVRLIKECGPLVAGGVFHCFGGTLEEMKQALDLGFYISISGIVTFKKVQNLMEVSLQIPLDRIVIETDAPFLAPVPHRGKRNEPAFVALVGEKIAEIRGIPKEEMAKITSANAQRLFGLSLRA
ncbi:MAG: TatD family hydrolase [Deltaproteobacteria bacterium]|nr:TatD family hydrolase [Deltaproteobacteria bacterium]